MIANVSAHRRANAFAQALEEPTDRGPAAEQSDQRSAPGATPDPAGTAPTGPRTEQQRLLTLAGGLADLPRPTLDPEVKIVQRAQLVAAMEAMLMAGAGGGAMDPSVPEQRSRKGTKGAHRAGPLRKLRPRSRLSKSLVAGGLTVGVAAGALGGVAAASSDALPGDSLYGLKRGVEDIKRGLADGDTDRGEIYLDQASTRLSEARRLMERDRGGHLDHESVGEVRRTLNGMRHDAAEGHRLLLAAYERDGSLGPIQALSAFSRSHRDSWSALRDRLPVQLGDVSQEVSSVFDAMEQEVEPLRSLLPEPPAPRGGPSQGPRTERSPAGPTQDGTERPAAPTRSGEGEAPRDTTPRDQGGGSPEPSAPDPSGKKDEGLLGGGTGGLLDTPKEQDKASPSPSGRTSPVPKPDVTLPPLLPGLLPGLGLDAEESGP
ncbi:hypothetical protein GT204_31550 [Streptomyces sp. SID4919]|uniref:DUF5667 domain-containing protein n=1 Tax=unclassified Streptomyces TaxID=2593676 RepID=UPI0008239C49|nr:DUF5667 domain-containing protein [Streptomyces sp. AmelKG-E11A]MYY13290.1 hypothetical protein [Streptomyces sp. SID4919]SCK61786.1 hypothetical protein YW7DRAFT_06398 [Streptomyces sp. AmelKG-E11A]